MSASVFDAIVREFGSRGWQYRTIREHVSVEFFHESHGDGWSIIGTASDETRRCLIRSVLPWMIPAPRRCEAAELINKLNWRLWIGNFEMNPDDGRVVFRTSLTLPESSDNDLLTPLVSINVATFEDHIDDFLSLVFSTAQKREAARRRALADARRRQAALRTQADGTPTVLDDPDDPEEEGGEEEDPTDAASEIPPSGADIAAERLARRRHAAAHRERLRKERELLEQIEWLAATMPRPETSDDPPRRVDPGDRFARTGPDGES